MSTSLHSRDATPDQTTRVGTRALRGPCSGKPIESEWLTQLQPRFEASVIKSSDGCWEWSGVHNRHGYSQISQSLFGRKRCFAAHRVSYELHIGPIPEGLTIDHLCRNRGCVNPAHLEPVTHHQNIRRSDRATKTHCPRGHAYSGENLRVRYMPTPHRQCRECERIRARRIRKLAA